LCSCKKAQVKVIVADKDVIAVKLNAMFSKFGRAPKRWNR
jgi:hypothetical protein